MVGKPAIRLCDKLLIEALLANARLVTRDQENSLPFRVKREGCAPFAVGGRETHLLHVGVFRALERVDIGPTELRAVFGEQLRDGQQFGLDPALENQKLRLEGVMQSDVPVHIASRLCRGQGSMCQASVATRGDTDLAENVSDAVGGDLAARDHAVE